jgi:hypothetical protein
VITNYTIEPLMEIESFIIYLCASFPHLMCASFTPLSITPTITSTTLAGYLLVAMYLAHSIFFDLLPGKDHQLPGVCGLRKVLVKYFLLATPETVNKSADINARYRHLVESSALIPGRPATFQVEFGG